MSKINDTSNCIIGEGSVFEGKFYVDGAIRIDGKFVGEIKTNDQLIIGPSGKVKTDIIAKKVTVAGILMGNINALEEVNLLQSGMILGNIKTPKLNVEEGVISQGEIIITASKPENIKKLIEESFGKNIEEEFNSFSKKTVSTQLKENTQPKK
jgi:cytoskeletal protein CcmA (bactofilin family)